MKVPSVDNPVQQADVDQSRVQQLAFLIAICAAVCLSVVFSVSASWQSGGENKIVLDGRINPNDAPAASMVRLPGIGIGRAAAIVAYREKFGAEHGQAKAFEKLSDLQNINGIGPKTTENLKDWIKFE